MRANHWWLMACLALAGQCNAADSAKPDPSAPAEQPAGVKQAPAKTPTQPTKELRFEPPPVPDFMLKKPAKPLTLEEMKKQADEAAEKARSARAAGGGTAQTPGSGAESSSTKPQ